MLGSGLRGKISIENSTLGTVTACRVTVTHHTLHPATWRQIFNASQTSAHVCCCARRLRHAPCVLPSATEPSRRLLHLFGIVCRRQYVHRRHYQFSAEDWRLDFLSGLTAVLPHERLTVLTTTWPHIIVTCPCSPRTLCHVKSIRYHHHQGGQSSCVDLQKYFRLPESQGSVKSGKIGTVSYELRKGLLCRTYKVPGRSDVSQFVVPVSYSRQCSD